MYVVKKPFKSNGKFYDYGDVIKDDDVANIKLFKSKVGFGKIVEVTEQNANAIKLYFKDKYSIDVNFTDKTAKESAPAANPVPARVNPAPAKVSPAKIKA